MTTKKLQIIDRGEVKRGDTWAVAYIFEPPYVGFNWSGATVDCALTSVDAPNDNTGAAATRIGQSLSIDGSNVASYTFQLTAAESRALVPAKYYKDECQLKQGVYVVTPVTGKSLIAQDYVI